MEQQKLLYTHKQCEIKRIRNVHFLFSFPFNQTEPRQRVLGYTTSIK